MKRSLSILPLFLLLSVGGGALLGMLVDTGGWYAAIEKPGFNPPDWVFGPVWGTLYVLIGVAGWRVWEAGELQAARIWWLQIAFNFAWPPIFFTAHGTGIAFLVLLALLATIIWFIIVAAKAGDRVSAWLFAPYALWVAYAGALNAAIWSLN